MSDFLERLETYIASTGREYSITQLTPDASIREYFRLSLNDDSAIACVYPEPFIAAEHNYIDVTGLFLRAGLPVGRILDVNEKLGVIVIRDFGDRILRDVMLGSDPTERERLVTEAVALIPRIQAATADAFETDSIASRLRFDTEKLLWELNFFKEHYFGTYQKRPLSDAADAAIAVEFMELSRELDERARVLCHRDFHAANLMVAGDGSLKIIDHQDARIGSAAYDLVSFLLDRVTVPPPAEWIAEHQRGFHIGRERLGLEPLDPAAFAEEFRLQTIQRCLKAVGTFSFQSATRGKTYFLPFIKPMLGIVADAVAELGRFPELAKLLDEEIRREGNPHANS